MTSLWLKSSPRLNKGISIINELDNSRFEQFLRRIVSKLKIQNTEIFSEDEIQKLCKIFQMEQDNLLIAIQTLAHIFKNLQKFILVPQHLKNDLKSLGLAKEKAEFILKLWSTEIRITLDELDTKSIENLSESLDFSWSLNAELSSDYCKKTKVPKAYLQLTRDMGDTELEVTHSELYSMYLQCEAIQNKLDALGV